MDKKQKYEAQEIVVLTKQLLVDNGFDLNCISEELYRKIAGEMRKYYEVTFSDTLRVIAADLRLFPRGG